MDADFTSCLESLGVFQRFKSAKVLITPGKIRLISHSEYIKISNIKSSKIYSFKNRSGEFNVKLGSGEYTFF